jgi:hypothetical protein
MTIKELKEQIKDLPDDIIITIEDKVGHVFSVSDCVSEKTDYVLEDGEYSDEKQCLVFRGNYYPTQFEQLQRIKLFAYLCKNHARPREEYTIELDDEYNRQAELFIKDYIDREGLNYSDALYKCYKSCIGHSFM